jgi:hypothetical protein
VLRTTSSYLFLIVAVLIGLGAFGHGHSVHKVHAAIDQFAIDPAIVETLYVVWYFVSGTMLVFGALLVWVWLRVRAGDANSLFPAFLIGAFYVVVGVCALVYRHGDRFWLVFIILGVLLLGSSLVLRASLFSATRRASAA